MHKINTTSKRRVLSSLTLWILDRDYVESNLNLKCQLDVLLTPIPALSAVGLVGVVATVVVAVALPVLVDAQPVGALELIRRAVDCSTYTISLNTIKQPYTDLT